jgi:hypothetical protein
MQRICQAISGRRLLQFFYTGDGVPGFRTVEPHMVAYTRDNHLALSAWYLTGASESSKGPGWRVYLLKDMSQITVLEQHFASARPGYQRSGGKSFTRVQCAL